jgi:hypothetical protein
MLSIAQIVSNASSNVSLYNSFQIKDGYYKKCVNPSVLITSLVEEKLEEIAYVECDIVSSYLTIKDNDKRIKELKKKLSSPDISACKFMINSFLLKEERKERSRGFVKIYSLNQYNNEIIKSMEPEVDEMERPSFSTNLTIMQSNKLRGILRDEKKKSYLMNMSEESRNKRKNSREMNKLLFGENKASNKHNKIRKTKSPNKTKNIASQKLAPFFCIYN